MAEEDTEIWTVITVHTWAGNQPDLNMDEPWLLKNAACVETWRASPKVQLVLSNFGGVTLLDETYERAGIVSKATWLYGNDPKDCFCSTTPFCSAMLKTLGVGETLFVLFNVVSLLKAKETLGENTEVTLDDLATEVRGTSVVRAKVLRQHGCTIVRACQAAWELIYVPTGWVVLESTPKGSLVYGCRKSCVVGTDLARKAYLKIIKLTAAGKKPIENMKTVYAEMCAFLGVSDEDA